ncbi:hypothetical protein OROHE_019336 [Orobanche hederae]
MQTLHTKDIIALLNKDKLPDRPHASLNINTQQTVPIHDILATTEHEYGCLFECRSCHLNKIATPRYRISLSVFDETGEIEVSMFGKEGEKLLNLPADDFWQKYQEDGNTILSYTVQLLDCQKIAPLPACTDDSTEQPSSASANTLKKFHVPASTQYHALDDTFEQKIDISKAVEDELQSQCLPTCMSSSKL